MPPDEGHTGPAGPEMAQMGNEFTVIVTVFDVAVFVTRQPPVTVISHVTVLPFVKLVLVYVLEAELCTLPPFTLKL